MLGLIAGGSYVGYKSKHRQFRLNEKMFGALETFTTSYEKLKKPVIEV